MAMDMYVMDFGVILKSKTKCSYFALNDLKSSTQRFKKILEFTDFRIVTFTDDFAENCIEKNIRSKMDEYIFMYGKRAKSVSKILGVDDILKIVDWIPPNQQQVFMSVA